MQVILSDKKTKEEIEMREMYCQTLIEMAEEDERIVMLDADLMNSMKTVPFMEKFPERTFNCGVQEANMIGTAAGLSATGKIPFAHTFAPFASRRCFDQVFISAAYARLNVRIIGSDPGITAAYNGGTHMPFEDMGLMRNIPGITIVEPSDATMLRDVIRKTVDQYGIFYIRLLRKNAIKIYDDRSEFEIGKAVKLKEGKDVTIFAIGIMGAPREA
jgi:transketolase